jgi:polysaccharide biosynthesis/export protein
MCPKSRKPHMAGLILGISLMLVGCAHSQKYAYVPDVPRENRKTNVSAYVINSPDVVVIDLVGAVPLPPYKLKPGDAILVQVPGAPKEDPIRGVFRIEGEGVIRFGLVYGNVSVVDMTVDEAQRAISNHLKSQLQNPQASVSLEESRGSQTIRGEHLVRPDGTVNLGIYGKVHISGLTEDAAKERIEQHLCRYFLRPTVSLDVVGFNSSVFYVIFDGGGNGEQVNRLPYTGNETVLDAVGSVSGLPAVASKSRIWLARPSEENCCNDIYPVNWNAIVRKGRPETNYQIFPGDRIYVAADPFVTIDTHLSRFLAPFERIFGITLLGSSTIHSVAQPLNQNNNNNGTTNNTINR